MVLSRLINYNKVTSIENKFFPLLYLQSWKYWNCLTFHQTLFFSFFGYNNQTLFMKLGNHCFYKLIPLRTLSAGTLFYFSLWASWSPCNTIDGQPIFYKLENIKYGISSNIAYLPYCTKRFVRWYAMVRLYSRNVNSWSAPAGCHFLASPGTRFNVQKRHIHIQGVTYKPCTGNMDKLNNRVINLWNKNP